MEAELTIQRHGASRTVAMSDFGLGLLTTCLQPDELLTSIRFRVWPEGCGHGFVEYGRRHGDFAIVSAAALVDLSPEGVVRRCALTLGGVGPVPFRVDAAEQLLQGVAPDGAAVKLACAQASKCPALNDPSYPEWYRQRLAATLLERALNLALGRARSFSTKAHA